jgi:hypothetical protein
MLKSNGKFSRQQIVISFQIITKTMTSNDDLWKVRLRFVDVITQKTIFKIKIQPYSTLRQIHNALEANGKLDSIHSATVMYFFTQRPIFREFWDVFDAESLQPTVLIDLNFGEFKLVCMRRMPLPKADFFDEKEEDSLPPPLPANDYAEPSFEPPPLPENDYVEPEFDPPPLPIEEKQKPKPVKSGKPPKSIVDDAQSDISGITVTSEQRQTLVEQLEQKQSSSATPNLIVKAVFPYDAAKSDFLSFKRGDLMEILIHRKDGRYWFARKIGSAKQGWIPHNYVRIVTDK